MPYHFRKIILFISAIILLQFIAVNLQADGKCSKKATWDKISEYMSPAPEYAGNYGNYRSPLVFDNGRPVKTKSDWAKRRKEIKAFWMKTMGEWPPIIKNQDFEILESSERDDFKQYKVRFRWTPKDTVTGYLLVPSRKGKKPAVITVFYEPETAIGLGGKPNRDFAYQLARRGFVTLSIGTTETTEAKTYALYYPSIDRATIQPLSALAYAASNAFEALARHKEVDAKRIGIMGHSYGGKWAMFASCLNEKFACAVWVDPGIVFDETKGGYINYWEPWYLGYYPPPWRNVWSKDGSKNCNGVYHRLKDSGHDLHELHSLMAPRPFFVSGGYSDGPERWIPLNNTVKVNELLGYKNRVGMSNRPLHDPNPESNEIAYSFFEYYL